MTFFGREFFAIISRLKNPAFTNTSGDFIVLTAAAER